MMFETTDILTFANHIKGMTIGGNIVSLPYGLITDTFNRSPAAHFEHFINGRIACRSYKQTIRRNNAYQVMKLTLNRCQIIKDIGMIKLKII